MQTIYAQTFEQHNIYINPPSYYLYTTRSSPSANAMTTEQIERRQAVCVCDNRHKLYLPLVYLQSNMQLKETPRRGDSRRSTESIRGWLRYLKSYYYPEFSKTTVLMKLKWHIPLEFLVSKPPLVHSNLRRLLSPPPTLKSFVSVVAQFTSCKAN